MIGQETSHEERDLGPDSQIEKAKRLLPLFLKESATVFLKNFTDRSLIIEEKGAADFVTHVDREIEDLFANWIEVNFPGTNLVGEERGLRTTFPDSDWQWAIDPVDGTTNYINGNPECSIVIALRHKGEPVLALCCLPLKNEVYVAVKGNGVTLNEEKISPTSITRLDRSILMIPRFKSLERMNIAVGELWNSVGGVHMKMSAVSEVCDVASGKAGIGVWFGLGPHEWAAAYLFAKETGCIISTVEKRDEPFDFSGNDKRNVIIAGNQALFDQAKDKFGTLPPPTKR